MWEIEIPMKRCDKYVTYVTNVLNMLNILLTRAYNKSAKLREKFPHMSQMCEIDPTYVTN